MTLYALESGHNNYVNLGKVEIEVTIMGVGDQRPFLNTT